MSMAYGWKHNLGLLTVVALLAGGLHLLGDREAKKQEADKSARKLSPITASEAVRLRFQGEDKQPVVLEKQEGTWRITQPQAVRADGMAVQELLKPLEALYDRQATPAGAETKPFGLDPPAATLEAENAAGARHKLLLGGTAPVGSARYVQVGETGPVALTAAQTAAGLLQGYADLRDKRLLPAVKLQEVTRVAITPAAGPPVTVERDGEQRWRLTSPLADAVHRERVTGWLNMLVMAGGSGFEEQAAPTTPDWTLAVTSNGQELSLPIWKAGDHLLTRRPGEPDALKLYAQLADELSKPPLELVDLRPLPEGGRPTALTVERHADGKREQAEFKEGHWPKPAWTAVEEALTREAWRVTAAVERGQPTLTITVGEGAQAKRVPSWQAGEQYFLAPPGRPVHLQLSALQAETLRTALAALLDPPPPAPAKEDKQP